MSPLMPPPMVVQWCYIWCPSFALFSAPMAPLCSPSYVSYITPMLHPYGATMPSPYVPHDIPFAAPPLPAMACIPMFFLQCYYAAPIMSFLYPPL